MKTEPRSIMVIDDHPIIQDGLKTLLADEQDLVIQATASSATEAMAKLRKSELPDIAIVDLSLSDADGTYLIQRLKAKYVQLRILVYTMSEEKLFAERAAMCGANGYVMKTSPPSILKEAIRTILAAGDYFTPDVMKRVQKILNGRNKGTHSPLDTLSNRELEVFRLLGQGYDAAGISDKLNISRNTVDTHRINIKNKLDQPNGKALERYAYEVMQKGKLP